MLKLEESLVAEGGYHPTARRPQLQFFRDSITCLTFGHEELEPCDQGWLMNFVPPDANPNVIPCHQIALNQNGDTVASLEAAGDRERLEQAILAWLRSAIAKLEEELKQSR